MSKKKTTSPPKWNPSKRVRAFLAAYKVTGRITKAAAAAGISRWAHYRLLEKSAAYRTEFAKADRISGDSFEDEAVRRAFHGGGSIVTYHGEPIMAPDPENPSGPPVPLRDGAPSDMLLAMLLKAKKPKEYRERVEHAVDPDTTLAFKGSMTELLDLYRTLTKA